MCFNLVSSFSTSHQTWLFSDSISVSQQILHILHHCRLLCWTFASVLWHYSVAGSVWYSCNLGHIIHWDLSHVPRKTHHLEDPEPSLLVTNRAAGNDFTMGPNQNIKTTYCTGLWGNLCGGHHFTLTFFRVLRTTLVCSAAHPWGMLIFFQSLTSHLQWGRNLTWILLQTRGTLNEPREQ